MKTKSPSKICYRCANVVRMTVAEFYYSTGPFAEGTCCDVCDEKLEIECDAALQPMPRNELKPPAPWRVSAWDSGSPKESAPEAAS